MWTEKQMFDSPEWEHLCDVIFEATDKESDKEEALKFFRSLPDHIQSIAFRWGMGDTVFRDFAYEYLLGRRGFYGI